MIWWRGQEGSYDILLRKTRVLSVLNEKILDHSHMWHLHSSDICDMIKWLQVSFGSCSHCSSQFSQHHVKKIVKFRLFWFTCIWFEMFAMYIVYYNKNELCQAENILCTKVNMSCVTFSTLSFCAVSSHFSCTWTYRQQVITMSDFSKLQLKEAEKKLTSMTDEKNSLQTELGEAQHWQRDDELHVGWFELTHQG